MIWYRHGRILLTVREMMADRGYGDEILECDGEVGDAREILRCSGARGSAIAMVGTKDNTGVKVIQAIAERYHLLPDTEDPERGSRYDPLAPFVLLLVKNSITPFARTELATMQERGLRLTIFNEKEVSFNVSRCALVPPHREVPPDEWTTLRRSVPTLTKEALPAIRINDPVVKYYGWGEGTIVRVERNMGGQQWHPVFRVVIA